MKKLDEEASYRGLARKRPVVRAGTAGDNSRPVRPPLGSIYLPTCTNKLVLLGCGLAWYSVVSSRKVFFFFPALFYTYIWSIFYCETLWPRLGPPGDAVAGGEFQGAAAASRARRARVCDVCSAKAAFRSAELYFYFDVVCTRACLGVPPGDSLPVGVPHLVLAWQRCVGAVIVFFTRSLPCLRDAFVRDVLWPFDSVVG